MPKKKEKAEEKPVASEEKVVKEETVEKEKKVEKKKDKELGFLGVQKIKVTYIGKKEINGREYNDVHLINGTTHLLSDRDLEQQLKKQ